ncbi:MAG: hypothetical protein WAQ05_06805, partial [Rubrivivax sp.]
SALLHRLCDDGELAEIAARLEAAVEPSVRSGLQTWMVRALNPQESSQLGLAPGDGLRAGTPGS